MCVAVGLLPQALLDALPFVPSTQSIRSTSSISALPTDTHIVPSAKSPPFEVTCNIVWSGLSGMLWVYQGNISLRIGGSCFIRLRFERCSYGAQRGARSSRRVRGILYMKHQQLQHRSEERILACYVGLDVKLPEHCLLQGCRNYRIAYSTQCLCINAENVTALRMTYSVLRSAITKSLLFHSRPIWTIRERSIQGPVGLVR